MIFDRRANGLLRVNYRTRKFCLSTSFSFLSFFFFQREGKRLNAVPVNARQKPCFFYCFDFSVEKRSRAKTLVVFGGGANGVLVEREKKELDVKLRKRE